MSTSPPLAEPRPAPLVRAVRDEDMADIERIYGHHVRHGLASFEDAYGLLRGAVRHAKHLKMKTMADVNEPALRYYVKQAVRIDRL